jgi:hypothetical protein
MLSRGTRLIAGSGFVFLASSLSTQCTKSPAPPSHIAPPPLLGEMKPVVSVKELMASMIDPFADTIFDAVWWEYGLSGMTEHRPTTDEEWQAIRVAAVTLAEGIYLLKVPRPFTRAGDVNDSVGAAAPELSPAQIAAKRENDPVLWNAKIEALRNVALATLDAVSRRNVDALFQAGADLDAACEGCHLEYWYPGDKKIVDQDRKARVRFESPR